MKFKVDRPVMGFVSQPGAARARRRRRRTRAVREREKKRPRVVIMLGFLVGSLGTWPGFYPQTVPLVDIPPSGNKMRRRPGRRPRTEVKDPRGPRETTVERTTPLPPLAPLDGAQPGIRTRSPARRRRKGWRPPPVPWTIYRYVVAEVLRVFLLGVLAVSIVYTTFAAYQTARSGLQLTYVWPLLSKTFAYPLQFSIPLAFLFAVTLAVGRMVGDLEVMALKSHGLSHIHVYAPVLGFGLALAGASFYLNGWVIPDIHYEKRNLQTYILSQLENLGSGYNRRILLPDDEGSLWVGAYEGTELRRVMVDLMTRKESGLMPALREHLPGKLPSKITVLAREGKLDIHPDRRSVILNLRSVQVLIPEVVRGTAAGSDYFHQTVTITENVLVPLSFAPKSRGIKDRSLPDLLQHIGKLREEAAASEEGAAGLARAAFKDTGEKRRGRDPSARLAAASAEVHRRLAFVFACLTFPLVGVALSLLLDRWSRLVPFFAGNLVVIVLFYPLLLLGQILGERGFVPAVSLAIPNAVLLGLGILLFRRVARP
jgi:lipopolysaccharide export LptBFGC system permease protein LptF